MKSRYLVLTTVALLGLATSGAALPVPNIYIVQDATDATDNNPFAGAPATPPETTLSGQKLLWALIGLAVPTILQASPADNFPAEASLSPSRTSPVICMVDILVILGYMGYGLGNGLGFRGSARLFRTDFDLTSPTETNILLSGIPTVKLALYVIAVLPSAIKIFAASGIPWTLAATIMFFTAYHLSAAVSSIGIVRHPDRLLKRFDTLNTIRMRQRFVYVADAAYTVAYVVQVAEWIRTLQAIFHLVTKDRVPLSVSTANTIISSLWGAFALLTVLVIVGFILAPISAYSWIACICDVLLYIGLMMLPSKRRFVVDLNGKDEKKFFGDFHSSFVFVGIGVIIVGGTCVFMILDDIYSLVGHLVCEHQHTNIRFRRVLRVSRTIRMSIFGEATITKLNTDGHDLAEIPESFVRKHGPAMSTASKFSELSPEARISRPEPVRMQQAHQQQQYMMSSGIGIIGNSDEEEALNSEISQSRNIIYSSPQMRARTGTRTGLGANHTAHHAYHLRQPPSFSRFGLVSYFPSRTRRLMAIVFAITNLTCAILHYVLLYHEQQSTVPPWIKIWGRRN